MSAEILAYNKSALCRSVNPTLSFVLLNLNPTTVLEHFLSHSNHSPTDVQLIPPEKIHSSRDSVREAGESHLIDKAMTLEPNDLNRWDDF